MIKKRVRAPFGALRMTANAQAQRARRVLLLFYALISTLGFSQEVKTHSFFFEWGYNREVYSKSTIRIYDGGLNDFKVYDVKAKDRPDYDHILKNPIQFTVPQYSIRLGCYLDSERKKALVLSFDHAKYVVVDRQTARVKGKLQGEDVDSVMVLDPDNFLHFEHTNGANFLQVGLQIQGGRFKSQGSKVKYERWSWTLQPMVGVVIPKTFVKLWGEALDNEFHVAGFIISGEVGVRYKLSKLFYLTTQIRTGFADYIDVLAACNAKASHAFFYAQGDVCLGLQISGLKFKKT